jgi:hypothetical protein
MYHTIAPENRPHLSPRQHGRDRQIPAESLDFSAPVVGAINCRQQRARPSAADRLAHLIKSGNCKTGAAREANQIAAAPGQQDLDSITQPRGQGERPAGRPREEPLCHCVFENIAARRYP